MIKIENVVTPSGEQWRAIILGARNPLNSWSRSDSHICDEEDCPHVDAMTNPALDCDPTYCEWCMGEKDFDLAKRLSKAGTSHRKFMRMITVYADVIAPLYWWKEFDTYKIGTVANSCSTMHKIHSKPIEFEDFSFDAYNAEFYTDDYGVTYDAKSLLIGIVDDLEDLRKKYLETKDKDYWRALIQILPNGYNQKRTVMLNYEVLANIYHDRKNHKLDCWIQFCEWIKSLPYSEIITGDVKDD